MGSLILIKRIPLTTIINLVVDCRNKCVFLILWKKDLKELNCFVLLESMVEAKEQKGCKMLAN